MRSHVDDDFFLDEYESAQEDDCDDYSDDGSEEASEYFDNDEYSETTERSSDTYGHTIRDGSYEMDANRDRASGAVVEYLEPNHSSTLIGTREWEAYKQGYRDGAADALSAVAREIVAQRSEQTGYEQQIAIEDRKRREEEERNSTLRMLDRLFAGITERLEDVRRMSDHMQGFWIFKSHVYSESELLQNPVFSEIYSKCGTFEDVLNRQGGGDPVVRATYESLKTRIMFKASEVGGYIQSRRSNGWEIVCTFLSGLFRAAVQYLTGTVVPRLTGW